MKSLRSVILIGIISLLVLCVTLGWSGYTFYNLEKKNISEHIGDLILGTAIQVQNDNLTLNNLVNSYADKDGSEKQAFAIGMNSNAGKMQLNFYEYKKNTEDGNVPVFTKDTLKSMHIEYLPTAVKHISYFDSLFRDTLTNERLNIPYHIVHEKEGGSNFSFKSDSTELLYEYHSRPFIINYYEPEVFRINYSIPAVLILKNMGAFIGVSVLLLLLVALAFFMYYHSYRTQQQMAEFKESLFSNITHELKTPLSSLQLIMDNAKNDKDKQISEEHLSFATGELNRMKLIVDKVLAYGKMSKEQFALNKEIVTIDEIITEATDVMSVMLTNNNSRVIYEPKPMSLTADRALLVNMFTALFDNSIKYNKQEPTITIRTRYTEDSIIIEAEDNGIGIPAEYHKNVFEPFFRVPTGNVHDVKGHGIGLSFVAQIVKLHGGNTHISDKKDEGTLFIITLPL